MSRPADCKSSMYCCCRELSSGSLISRGLTTWARQALQASKNGTNQDVLFLYIHHSGALIWRIGDQADVGNQGLRPRLAESISIRGHQCGLVQGRTAMPDDGDQVGVAHFIERVSVGESV